MGLAPSAAEVHVDLGLCQTAGEQTKLVRAWLNSLLPSMTFQRGIFALLLSSTINHPYRSCDLAHQHHNSPHHVYHCFSIATSLTSRLQSLGFFGEI
jgi:hypothetical protein